MPDPIDELENFTSPGLTMNPMPAAEVRRRGTRMRRRNTALATIGGIAAVAVIATPIAVLANNQGDKSDLQPAPPTVQWHQTIPDGFPLTAGMPSGTEQSETPAVDQVEACGDTAWSTDDPQPVDAAGAAFVVEGSSGSEDRTLALYADDTAAQQAFTTFHDALVDCPVDETGSGVTLVNDVREDDLGTDASFVFTNQVEDGTQLYDLTTYQVARSGNALYLASSHTSAGGDQVADDEVARLAEGSQSVLTELCVFSAQGCDADDAADDIASDAGSGSSAATVIPDGFDLLAGLPAEGESGDIGRVGPDRELAPVDLSACGTKGPTAGTALDRLRGDFRQARGGYERQLMTFPDEGSAQAYVDGVAALYPCTEDGGQGVTGYFERRDTDLGDSAVAAFLHFVVDGEPGPGYEMVHAVRVGQAVLLSRVQIDGDSTPVTDEVQAQLLDEGGAGLADVVDAMCAFSTDGC